jgi:hypothetical protein
MKMRAIVKVIRLNSNWHWQGVAISLGFPVADAVKEVERLAPFQYPSAKQIFVIPIFLN